MGWRKPFEFVGKSGLEELLWTFFKRVFGDPFTWVTSVALGLLAILGTQFESAPISTAIIVFFVVFAASLFLVDWILTAIRGTPERRGHQQTGTRDALPPFILATPEQTERCAAGFFTILRDDDQQIATISMEVDWDSVVWDWEPKQYISAAHISGREILFRHRFLYQLRPEAVEVQWAIYKPTEQRQNTFTGDSQHRLIETLKQYTDDDANVKILFANIKHKRLAETLISIFELAGWKTNLTNVPLEHYVHQYFEGIEILGYNKHLVDAVADALTKFGLTEVRSKCEVSGIKKDNVKWKSVQRYIKLTIGHRES
jgi:hypothetical protein